LEILHAEIQLLLPLGKGKKGGKVAAYQKDKPDKNVWHKKIMVQQMGAGKVWKGGPAELL